jgi:hypothetical protein
MTSYIHNRSTYVWLFLSIITVISWRLASAHSGNSYQANGWVTGVVLLIALIKTRFVIRNYMEVRFAPRWLQLTCDAWLVCLFGMIACFYWLSL